MPNLHSIPPRLKWLRKQTINLNSKIITYSSKNWNKKKTKSLEKISLTNHYDSKEIFLLHNHLNHQHQIPQGTRGFPHESHQIEDTKESPMSTPRQEINDCVNITHNLGHVLFHLQLMRFIGNHTDFANTGDLSDKNRELQDTKGIGETPTY